MYENDKLYNRRQIEEMNFWENHSAIFCRTYDVIHQNRNIVAFVNELAHSLSIKPQQADGVFNPLRLKEAGGNLVAISVENPDNSLNVAKKNELNFTVLSDPDLIVARKFGIVYQMPSETDELYKSRGLDVAKHNEMERAELPLSATYVVNRKGEIVYAYLEPDYKKRAEPQTIIETLLKIKSPAIKKHWFWAALIAEIWSGYKM